MLAIILFPCQYMYFYIIILLSACYTIILGCEHSLLLVLGFVVVCVCASVRCTCLGLFLYTRELELYSESEQREVRNLLPSLLEGFLTLLVEWKGEGERLCSCSEPRMNFLASGLGSTTF